MRRENDNEGVKVVVGPWHALGGPPRRRQLRDLLFHVGHRGHWHRGGRAQLENHLKATFLERLFQPAHVIYLGLLRHPHALLLAERPTGHLEVLPFPDADGHRDDHLLPVDVDEHLAAPADSRRYLFPTTAGLHQHRRATTELVRAIRRHLRRQLRRHSRVSLAGVT